MDKSKFRKALVTALLVLMLSIAGSVHADGPGSGGGTCSGPTC